MKKIRFGVFETNSSSSHSLSISDENMILETEWKEQFPLDDCGNNVIEIRLEECEFGWEYAYYNDPWDKLKYLIMMAVETEGNGCETIEDFYNTEGFQLIQQAVPYKIVIIDDTWEMDSYERHDGKTVRFINHDGYIDHQSYEDYTNLKHFLDYWGIDSVERFLYDKGVVIITDNDNH